MTCVCGGQPSGQILLTKSKAELQVCLWSALAAVLTPNAPLEQPTQMRNFDDKRAHRMQKAPVSCTAFLRFPGQKPVQEFGLSEGVRTAVDLLRRQDAK
jgi:hypothetical protein